MKNIILAFTFIILIPYRGAASADKASSMNVADLRIAANEKGQNLIYYTHGNTELQILDDTGFITSYMIMTYLLKRLVSLDVELNFKRHEVAKKELIRSLEVFTSALEKEKIAPKTIIQTKNAVSTLKNTNSMVGEKLFRLIMRLDESLRKESGFEARGQLRTLNSSKKNNTEWASWRNLKLPKVSDGLIIEYIP